MTALARTSLAVACAWLAACSAGTSTAAVDAVDPGPGVVDGGRDMPLDGPWWDLPADPGVPADVALEVADATDVAADMPGTDLAIDALLDMGLDPGDDVAICGGETSGTCSGAGVSCLCCAAGGPHQHCICSTPCQSVLDCTDAARPACNHPKDSNPGICAPADFICCWYCK